MTSQAIQNPSRCNHTTKSPGTLVRVPAGQVLRGSLPTQQLKNAVAEPLRALGEGVGARFHAVVDCIFGCRDKLIFPVLPTIVISYGYDSSFKASASGFGLWSTALGVISRRHLSWSADKPQTLDVCATEASCHSSPETLNHKP